MIIDKEKDYADVMEIVDSLEGHKFEEFCGELLKNNGYRDVVVTRGSGDYGVDITARYHNRIYGIQCKRYTGKVGIDAVRDALGGYDYYKCDIVAVLTNSVFTPNAVTQANISGVKLWGRKSFIDFIDNCENLDFIESYREKNIISEETVPQYSFKKRIHNRVSKKQKIKNYTVEDGGIYISNKKCSRTAVNLFRWFCFVSGIVICGGALLMLIITPLLGVGYFLGGLFFVLYSKKIKRAIKMYDGKYGK